MTSETEEQLLLRNIMGGMWKTNPVSTEPTINLIKWNVFAVADKDGLDFGCHFNGYSPSGYEGRVSSKIMSFDKETMIGTTRSGLQYRLMDMPGYDGDAHYVYQNWLRINKIAEDDVTDATGEFLTLEQKKAIKPNNPETWGDDIQSSNSSEV